MSLLTIDCLTKTYHSGGQVVTAADAVTLSADRGSVVALKGPSGSGKTTVLLCAGALLAPSGGTVIFDGMHVYGVGARQRNAIRAAKIGFVFQQFNLIPYLSVRENITLPALAARNGQDFRQADELLEIFALKHRAKHLPHSLSTGERQRTALARAVFNKPSLLCADEPTGNLDDDNAATVLGHLREFANDGGAVLLVTHDSRALDIADAAFEMDCGRARAA